MLGSYGVIIAQWYAEHNLLINGIIVLIALFIVFSPKNAKNIGEKINNFWRRTPFALPEEDRTKIEEVKLAYKTKKK